MGHWITTKDGDPRGLALYERHYSCYRYRDGRRRKLFCGPGEKLVLITRCGSALFVWRKFRSMDGQVGVNCAVFRNETAIRSSDLIKEAMAIAWRRWPGARLYTYVNPRAVVSEIPGYCFRRAGWRRCGETKRRKLLIFERLSPAAKVAVCLAQSSISQN